MAAVRTDNLSKEFNGMPAVCRLNLEVQPGEIFGLVGPDGAGKTTIMRLLTSIMEPSSGDAWVQGLHSVRDAEAIKEKIGYMSQRFGLYADLTVQENVDFYADIYGVPRRGREKTIDELLSFSALTPFKKRFAGNLSGGMKQKLGLACALIHTPEVLFLDEPTNGVDPVSRRDFWRVLYQLRQKGVTIVVSTAYLDEAERCSRLGLLHQGNLLSVGSPREIKSLMKGQLLVVRSSHPREAAQLLQEVLREEHITLFGDRIHVITDAPESSRTSITHTLSGSAYTLHSISDQEPSLEDVFVSMLGTTEKERSHEIVSS